MDKNFIAIQDLAGDIDYDIGESPKASALFKDIQEHLLGQKGKNVIRPISNRFLQMRRVAERLVELWDPLLVHSSSFLTREELRASTDFKFIFEQHETSEASQDHIREILTGQNKQAKSSTSSSRKERILLHLFQKRKQTLVALLLYRGILLDFESYVKLFQTGKPLAHRLHGEIFHFIKDFFGNFIEAAKLPLTDAIKLSELDIEAAENQLHNSKLETGRFCFGLLKECSRDKSKHPWLASFYKALRSAFVEGAKSLKKMPLLNQTLIQLSAMSPGAQRSSSTADSLLKLATKLPNVISSEELGELKSELKRFSQDAQVTVFEGDESSPNFRLDCDWWSQVFQLCDQYGGQQYKKLSSRSKAAITVFNGPLVESSFNIMGDIIREDRTAMCIENYEATAIIKQHLKVNGYTADNFPISEKMRNSVTASYSRYQSFQQNKKEGQQYNIKKPASVSKKDDIFPSDPVNKSQNTEQSQHTELHGETVGTSLKSYKIPKLVASKPDTTSVRPEATSSGTDNPFESATADLSTFSFQGLERN